MEATEGFKSGLTIFATSPSDSEGVQLAVAWVREKGYTQNDVSIRKYEGAVCVEVK